MAVAKGAVINACKFKRYGNLTMIIITLDPKGLAVCYMFLYFDIWQTIWCSFALVCCLLHVLTAVEQPARVAVIVGLQLLETCNIAVPEEKEFLFPPKCSCMPRPREIADSDLGQRDI